MKMSPDTALSRSRSVVDVSTLSAGTGDVFMIFVHMIYDVCRGVVDVSTLGTVSGDIFMIFVYMVYDVCLAKMQKYFQKGVISWVYLLTWKISVSKDTRIIKRLAQFASLYLEHKRCVRLRDGLTVWSNAAMHINVVRHICSQM